LGFVYLVVPLAGVLICYFSIDSFFKTLKSSKA
jgi:TRAP-type C4-dicarboxylate transport system permease small subunit